MMDRRRFLLTSLAGAVAVPLAGEAQQAGKVARVGILSSIVAPSPEEAAKYTLFTTLTELGWVAGQNIVFEQRFAAGQADRLPALAADLVRLRVDVIVTLLNQETLVAKQATASIPIVMLFGVAPVEAGLVASLARPGGNVTGTTVAPIAPSKYLELLKEAFPKMARVAVLWDPTFPRPATLEAEARKLALTLTLIEVQRPDEVEAALAKITQARPGALCVVPGGALLARIQQIIDFAAQHHLPTIFPARSIVDAGGLMSYGYDRAALLRRGASYVDRILRGAKPADLPVEQPAAIQLVINLKTAKALGLTIPPSLLTRADQVIE
jgi:putative ABC transport system substrate-binding protein